MRIGIDGRALTGRYTGDRTYWLNLLRASIDALHSDDHLIIYFRLPVPTDVLPPHPRVTFRSAPASSDRIWTLTAFPRALKEDGVDLAHTQYTIPLRPPCPVVTTVHDISFRIHPGWFPRRHRILLNLTVPSSMRRAAKVITVSESSRRDILRVYRLPEDKVLATPLAAAREYAPVPQETAWAAVKERLGVEGPYVLSVGVLQPRKNIPLLLEGFALARRLAGIPHELVVTGKAGWGYEGLERHAARLGIRDSIRMTGYVADGDLPALYSAAHVMAYPSLYEGFGLPPLEAMACGAPTLVSDAPAMPEVAGEGAWILPALVSSAWGEALARILTSEECRQYWSEKGQKRAKAFSWSRTAAETRAVYESALNRGLRVEG